MCNFQIPFKVDTQALKPGDTEMVFKGHLGADVYSSPSGNLNLEARIIISN